MDHHFPSVLLVEDDTDLRTMLEAALSEEGFEVVTASSGVAALDELASTGAELKAVVTDIKLGRGSNGWDVGHRAREVNSGIPVIYMSGDSAHEWSANGVPESLMLQKPCVIAQLVTALSTLLNQASSALALIDAMAADRDAGDR